MYLRVRSNEILILTLLSQLVALRYINYLCFLFTKMLGKEMTIHGREVIGLNPAQAKLMVSKYVFKHPSIGNRYPSGCLKWNKMINDC